MGSHKTIFQSVSEYQLWQNEENTCALSPDGALGGCSRFIAGDWNYDNDSNPNKIVWSC